MSAILYNSGVLDIDVDDTAEILFESINGFPVSIHLDFNSRNVRRKCMVRCTNVDLTWDIIQNKIICSSKNGDEEINIEKDSWDLMYENQLLHFFDCIENKKEPLVTLDDGKLVLKLIKAIELSSKTGTKVAI